MRKCRVCLVSAVQTSFWGSSRQQYLKKDIPQMEKLADELGFELTVIKESITGLKEARKAVDQIREGSFDFLMIQASTFADGEIILPLADAGRRIGLWAVPEITDEGAIPNNSFCGINMYGSIIHQYLNGNRPYKWFYGTADSQEFISRLRITVSALTAVVNLEGARVGLIGGIAPGFHDFYYDERLTRSRLGVTVTSETEFSDVYEMALSFEENVVKEMTKKIKGECRCVSKELTEETLENTARVYLAFERLMEEREYDAIAIGCWPRYRKELGIVVCSVIGRLLENGRVAACEGDVDSAISMMLLKSLSGKQPMLMDMSKFDESDETVLMWHCGSAPHSYADEEGVSLEGHYKPGSRVTCMDDKKVSSVHNMYYGSRPVTIARLTNNYQNMLTFTGEFVKKADKGYHGSRGWLGNLETDGRKLPMKELINTVMVQGFQHHYPIVEGNVEAELFEIMAWLNVQPLQWVPYRSYLQTAK